jgi:hypothetical protein
MIAIWCIWKGRNAYIFNDKVSKVAVWKILLHKKLNFICAEFLNTSMLQLWIGSTPCNFVFLFSGASRWLLFSW